MVDFKDTKYEQALLVYEREHAELDARLQDPDIIKSMDRLSIQRLKKRKLWLKDKIEYIRNSFYPDIIA